METAEHPRINEVINQAKKQTAYKTVQNNLLVAMGDSWFDLEKGQPYIDIDLGHHVLDHLEDLQYDVKSVADHGDLIESMTYKRKGQFDKLAETLHNLNKDEKVPRAVLLSGGGNDLVKSLKVMLNYRDSGLPVLNEDVVKGVVDVRLSAIFTSLFSWIHQLNLKIYDGKGIPILIHGYAHPVPDGRGAPLGIGPWLLKKFTAKGHYDLQENTNRIKDVIERFNTMLETLCNSAPFNSFVHYVDVRECLSNEIADDHYTKDWSDELHPRDDAFKRIALKFHDKLRNL